MFRRGRWCRFAASSSRNRTFSTAENRSFISQNPTCSPPAAPPSESCADVMLELILPLLLCGLWQQVCWIKKSCH